MKLGPADLARAWERYFFAPESPSPLALSRATFFGLLAALYAARDFSAWADVDSAYWFPIFLFERLRIPVLSGAALGALGLLWKLSLVSSAIGFTTRVSTALAFLLGAYLLGLPHNFGKVHHLDAAVVLVLGILALARSGDACSVDRALARSRGRAAPKPSGEYRWPVRAVWVILALVAFGAGFSKLRHSGLAWIFSDNMKILLQRNAYQVADSDPVANLGLLAAGFPLLCKLMALFAVATEIGYPLALIHRTARLAFPCAMLLLLLGIRFLMGPPFPELAIAHVFWIPWEPIRRALRRQLGKAVPARQPS